LSEAGYGVSLLNDCKYGHDIELNRIRLTLLRGTIRPDPDSDRGQHTFTYSLYPHKGTWQQAGTVRTAYDLNSPLTAISTNRHRRSLPSSHAFVVLQASGVHLGALKRAEEGKGYVLRLAELHGGREKVTVRLDHKIKQVDQCDLLERPERRVNAEDREFSLTVHPFEITTIRYK